MNAGPGKILLILHMLLLAAPLSALDYRYSLDISKRSLYLKEPFVVTFDINQTDSSKVMFFDFSIKNSGSFFVRRLDKQVDEGYHARKERYIYLLFPLKSGDLTIDFDLLVRRGNDELLTTAFTGGRYNVKAVETEDIHEEIPSKRVEVKNLPVDTDIVGNFKLKRHMEKTRVDSFEPLYIDIEINGTGYAPDIVDREWMPKIDGVKIFADKPKIELKYTKRGIVTKALFRYALVSEKGYRLPAIRLRAFDTLKRKIYTIDEPAVRIEVVPVDRASLIDGESSPAPLKSPLEALKSLLVYLLVFAAGWISALVAVKLKKGRLAEKESRDDWIEAVEASKDAKSLLKLLVLKDSRKFEPWIEKLEYALYGGGDIDLKEIKKEVLREK